MGKNKAINIKSFILLLAVLLMIFSISDINAVDISVSTDGIGTDYDNINDAVIELDSSSDTDNTITLKNGVYNKNTDVKNHISKNVTIIGETKGSVTIDVNNWMFNIAPDTIVTFENIRFVNGRNDIGGGAIYTSGSIINFNNCEFISCYSQDVEYGGAIYAIDSKVTINNTKFKNNGIGRIDSVAGAIYAENSDLKIYNSEFIDNFAFYGQAIAMVNGNLTIENSYFSEHNNAKTGYINIENTNLILKNSSFIGKIYHYSDIGGGAIYASNCNELYIEGTDFSEFLSEGYGGAIYCDSGNMVINDSKFNDTKAYFSGGSIYFLGEKLFINNTYFGDGRAENYEGNGGFIYNENGLLIINNSIFNDTQAIMHGGAIYHNGTGLKIYNSEFIYGRAGDYDRSGGGDIYNIGSDMTINNCNFTNSHCSHGAGIYSDGYNVNITNCNFINGTSNIAGSSIFFKNGVLIIDNSSFINGDAEFNTVKYGAVYGINSKIIINNSLFDKNHAYGTSHGGAIASNDSDLTVYNTTFTTNNGMKGGAIYAYGGLLYVTNSTFDFNRGAQGGAIYFEEISDVNINNSTFSENYAVNGGAIASYYSNNILINNISFNANNGGAIYFREINDAYINNSSFIENYVGSGNKGGAITIFNSDDIIIDDCYFNGNRAIDGGAIYLSEINNINIANSTFVNNIANTYGGAIFISGGSDYNIYNSTFEKNNGRSHAGAIYITKSENINIDESIFKKNTGNYAGVIYALGTINLVIKTSEFLNNSAPNGGVFYLSGAKSTTLDNSIFEYNNASSGGVLFIYNTINTILNNSEFNNNDAIYFGGVIYSYANTGYPDTFNITVENCKLDSNSAIYGGGAIYNQAFDLTIKSSNITNNAADNYGGGIYNNRDTLLIIDSRITGNVVTYGDNPLGGGIYTEGSIIINNSLIENNTHGITLATLDYELNNNDIIENGYGIQFVLDNKNIIITDLVNGGTFADNDYAIAISGSASNYTFINSFNDNINGIIITWDNNQIINSNISDYNGIGIKFLYNFYSSVLSSNIINNTIGISIDDYSDYITINNNRIINNKNIEYNGILNNNINANLNWWGNNTPIIYTNINMTNWYVIKLFANNFSTIKNDTISIMEGEIINLTYAFTINDGSDHDIMLLPNFNLTIIGPNGNISNMKIHKLETLTYTVGETAGNYSISGLSDNEHVVLSINVKYNMEPTTIEVDNATSEVNKTVELKSELLDELGNPLEGKLVKFYIDGELIGSNYTNSEGIAIFNYISNKTGNFTIFVEFEGYEKYLPSNNTGILSITPTPIPDKKPTTIETDNVTGEVNKTVELKAELLDESGNPLEGKLVKFYIDGEYIGSNHTNSEGIAIFNYISNKTGNFTIFVEFEGDETYLASNNTGILSITSVPDKKPTTIETNNVTGEVNKTVELKAELLDESGNPLEGKLVKFYIGGEYIGSNHTNSKGIAIFNHIKNKTGNYTIFVEFEGDETYLSSNNTAILSITHKPIPEKKPTTIESYDITSEVNKSIELKAELLDESGNPLEGKLIKFYIDGEYIGSNHTNSKGIAILNYITNKAGTFTIFVIFEGDEAYLSSNNTSLLTVISIPTPKPEPVDPNKTETHQVQKEDISTIQNSMKNTGNPIFIIILVLFSICGIVIRNK
ncbi:Ig-like domain-containing protein [Methanobrevibacter sp. DSM 116169]|uniref:right-handed parallel beta-helix repeat-containing protein n=1 Tax=Methanobrevibacter sp. DSM 116169 TaxID=3242727 RepID=UPI0038FCD032